MTPERFRQIRHLFDAALERDADVRMAFLAEACQGDEDLRAEVERLLAAHDQPAALLDLGLTGATSAMGDAGRMEGRRIGQYEILRELGHGGMGAVYLAVRTDDVYRKAVAIKIVRPETNSADVIQRFQQEREIVASLDHPNIARLLDGGATPEGLPYLVMDYVDGQPIDVYSDAHHLSVAARLQLFRSVCFAVEYAHQHHVVHRDLKPSNIFVMRDGVVKLLDFGIAKLLPTAGQGGAISVTRTGLRLMTPEYASPEQVKGEPVGVAADVYALGVVLYELLTGHRPYRMRSRLIHEVVRVICEEEPTRPSTVITEVEERPDIDGERPIRVTPQSVSRTRETTAAELRRQLSGEIDNIVLTALRKDPAQRYRSASGFSDDIQRHLDGQPVMAQGHGLTYRAGKMLARHPVSTAAAALVVAGLATGAVKVNVWAAAFLILLIWNVAMTYWIGRMEFGSDLAKRLVTRRALPVTFGLGLFLLIGFALFTFRPSEGDVGWVEHLSEFLIGLWIATGLWSAMVLVRWRSRRRWAGMLLLDLSRARGAAARTFLAVMGILMLLYVAMFISMLPHPRPIPLFYLMGLAPFTAYRFGLWGRVEIRERGVLRLGLLIRWPRVESYAWEPAGRGFEVLKLRVRRRLSFLPIGTKRMLVPADRRREADAILNRQFSEWPGRTGG